MQFKLIQKAKRGGGDKYVSILNEDFVVYIPQSICRVGGEPLSRIWITIGLDQGDQ
jgi:hypothetical protein